MANPVEARIQAVVLEGLFVRGLKLAARDVEALRGLGIDLDRLEPDYPLEKWQRALDLIGARCFPGRSSREIHFELGRAMVRGYTQTLLGKVVTAATSLAGPGKVLERLPRIINGSRTGDGIRATLETVGERERRLVVVADRAMPDFYAGLVTEAVGLTKSKPTVEVIERSPRGFTLAIRW